jgi:23S rRNA pseudouridine1911/1915/1917 synthase
VATLVADGQVTLDGHVVTSRSRALQEGQLLEAVLPGADATGPQPDPRVEFRVIHEDEDLIVVDKPVGLVVHHGAGHHGGTLADGLLARYPELRELPVAGAGDVDRPGIVHRLDKGTSGLLVVARTPAAFQSLSEQLRRHTATRIYLVLVVGNVTDDAGMIDAPIGRSERQPTKMTVSNRGRAARTRYRVLARYHEPVDLTLLEATLETGRTHQVRVHLAAIGHPVVGDDRYGTARSRPPELVGFHDPARIFLHAHRLELDHPKDGSRVAWSSPLPADLRETLDQLDRRAGRIDAPPDATG